MDKNIAHLKSLAKPLGFWVALLCFQLVFSTDYFFDLTVTATDESCIGNGAIEATTTNVTPDATIMFELFALPDTTTPIAQNTDGIFNNLTAGDYLVVATENDNGTFTEEEQQVTVADAIEELDYTITHEVITGCDVTGTLIIEITSGYPDTYEIISGPVTAPPQSSNEFTGLPGGTYVVRIYDTCGNAVTKTYSFGINQYDFVLSATTLPLIYEYCDEVTLTNEFTSANNLPMVYPQTVTYVIMPTNGDPETTFTQVVSSGDDSGFTVTQDIQLSSDDPFSVSVSIIDDCGNVIESESILNPMPVIALEEEDGECWPFLRVTVYQFMPPYQMAFTDMPADFTPADLNNIYPGPYTEPENDFGDDETPVSFGTYEVEITDACGRTATASILIEEEVLEPSVQPSNTGCDEDYGSLFISLPQGRDIVSGEILLAPPEFNETLPYDVSEFVTANGHLDINDILPVGDYIFTIMDECGVEYEIPLTIPEFSLGDLIFLARPDCADATGSVRVSSGNAALENIIMTSAPATYPEDLPHDVSSYINSNGVLWLYYLPIGTYSFETVDVCGYTVTGSAQVVNYVPTPYNYNLTRNCGSFNIVVVDDDTSVTNQTYWLQLYYPEDDSWGHPNTGELYTEGDMPNSTTAIEMQNNQPINNIFLEGDFRIIKAFSSYNDQDSFCLDIMDPFTVYSNLTIAGEYNLNCDDGSINDVAIDAIGVEPFNFSIVSPYDFDNGTSNVFEDLAPDIYDIQVEDACGNIENITVNTENLSPLAQATQPDDMALCDENGNDNAVFDLTQQTEAILGNQNPNDYIVTYYATQDDADNAQDPLNLMHTNTSNPQTVYARVEHESLNLCYVTTSFNLYVGNYPEVINAEPVIICQGESATLTAPGGYDYLWESGETSQSIVVNEAGTYSVTLQNTYGNFTCDSVQEFTVIGSSVATVESIATSDWTANQNTIAVEVSGTGDYEYSLDGVSFQTEPVFYNLAPGDYAVYVQDINGCGVVTETVSLLNYPKFFTPNGDGYNDVWQIISASSEPELKVEVYNRYGKLLTHFNALDYGWDGTYNGHLMPTSDYWFVVTRANGNTHKGHFTLKR